MTRKEAFKGDRALELYEQRVPVWVIAERLGTSSQSVCAMVKQAQDRRAKQETDKST